MYEYPGGNQQYQGYPDYPPPYYYPPRRKRGGFFFFLLWAAVVLIAAYFTTNYVEGRGGLITQPGTDEPNSGGWGFRILPNDPLTDQQYALTRLNANQAWNITKGNNDLIVAVIDTGVDPTHPDLQGKLVKGYDFVNNSSRVDDTVGHGTFVASLIAAQGNDNSGITGIAPNVKIMPLKVMTREDNGSSSLIAKAVRYAADNGAKVVNISLGSPAASRTMRSAIDYAVSKGVVVVAASGNEGDQGNPPEYPASFPDVISVTATNSRDSFAAFSNHNQAVAVSAPGVNILGARSRVNQICRPYQNAGYCVASGTSFASPYVAGTAALMLSANPELTPQQVKDILEQTAKDLGPKGPDVYYGYGRIDAGKAVEMAKAA